MPVVSEDSRLRRMPVVSEDHNAVVATRISNDVDSVNDEMLIAPSDTGACFIGAHSRARGERTASPGFLTPASLPSAWRTFRGELARPDVAFVQCRVLLPLLRQVVEREARGHRTRHSHVQVFLWQHRCTSALCNGRTLKTVHRNPQEMGRAQAKAYRALAVGVRGPGV